MKINITPPLSRINIWTVIVFFFFSLSLFPNFVSYVAPPSLFLRYYYDIFCFSHCAILALIFCWIVFPHHVLAYVRWMSILFSIFNVDLMSIFSARKHLKIILFSNIFSYAKTFRFVKITIPLGTITHFGNDRNTQNFDSDSFLSYCLLLLLAYVGIEFGPPLSVLPLSFGLRRPFNATRYQLHIFLHLDIKTKLQIDIGSNF